ncbi:hypothetical protein J2S21_003902 [Peribacillus cavernae]|nr:hypothetical protein [Peribacillus cavernae]
MYFAYPTALPLTVLYFQNAVFDYILEIKVFNSPTNILLIQRSGELMVVVHWDV